MQLCQINDLSKLSLPTTLIPPLSRSFTHNPFTTATLKPVCQILSVLALIIALPTMTSLFGRLTRPCTSPHLKFTPEQAAQLSTTPAGAEKVTLAAGCFWGVEHMYRKDFGGKGLLDARVGYIGGDTDSPSYRAVCSGRTGRTCT